MGAARREEVLAAANTEFLDRFEAVYGKAGRGDRHLGDAPRGIGPERDVGRRLKPFGAAEAGLEGDIDLVPHRLAQQPRGLAAMAMIGIAQLERPLRHSVEAQQQAIGGEIERLNLALKVGLQRRDVGGVVMVRGQRPKRWLPAHRGERREGGIVGGGRRCGAILRVKRGEQDPLTAAGFHRLDRGRDSRIAVAHRMGDQHAIAKPRLQCPRLPRSDCGERRSLLAPHLGIGMGALLWPGAKDDSVEDRLPRPGRDFDHALVAQKLGEIAPHRACIGRVGSAEIDKQHADLAGWDERMVGRRLHHPAMGLNGRSRKRRPVPAARALARHGPSII